MDENKKLTCTLSIRCDTILNNMNLLKEEKKAMVPSDGVILETTTITFSEGESVFDVLKWVTREQRIQMEFEFTPMYNSAYIEGIHNLYEFDCGDLSGWMYKVNGWFPNYGCSRYQLKQGDVIEWVYTCDLGKDVGERFCHGTGWKRMNKDTFSSYHPAVSMLYFVLVIGLTMFLNHPVCLGISLIGALTYSIYLKGKRRRGLTSYICCRCLSSQP